jgi:uncharacterized protein
LSLGIEQGTMAVRLARETLDAHVRGEEVPTRTWSAGPLSERRGVFVTLNLAAQAQEGLRGCIGFPYPVNILGRAIRDATIAAASEDPRFPPVRLGELDSIVVEVSVLTVPESLGVSIRRDLPSHIRIGVDGLIVSGHGLSGLLLPQVATDFGMDQIEFISQACMKAGLLPDAWLTDDTDVQVFQAEIFAELRPRGEVVKVIPMAPRTKASGT